MAEIIKVIDQAIQSPESQRITDLNTVVSIENPKFVKTISGFDNQFSCAMTSRTFTTNKEEYLQSYSTNSNSNNSNNNTNDTWQILDGFYSVATLDGYVFAFGDGCGGHIVSKQEDDQIANAVKIMAETAIDALLKYDSAEAISENLNYIFNTDFTDTLIKKLSEAQNNYNTTVITGRTFRSKKGFFRLVGFSVGDSSLIAYNPHTKTFTNIAPAIQSLSGSTANFPGSYKAEDIFPFDIELEEGTIIMPFSDGISEFLPQNKEEENFKTQRKYLSINASKMQNILSSLPKEASVRACIGKIMEKALKNFNKNKQEKLNNLPKAVKEYEEINKKISKIQEKISKLESSDPNKEKYKLQEINLRQQLEEVRAKCALTIGDDCLIAGLKLPTTEETERFVLSLFKAAIIQKNENSLRSFAQQFPLEQLEEMLVKLDSSSVKKESLQNAQAILYQTLAEQKNSNIVKREVSILNVIEENSKENNNNATPLEKSFLHENNQQKSLRKVKIFSEEGMVLKYTFFMKSNQVQKFEEKKQQYQNELSNLQYKK